MTPPPTWLDHLKLLAAAETVPLADLGREALDELLARGLLHRDDRPRQSRLEAQYEALQETHRHLLEARSLADRLQRRLAPKSRLAGLLPLGGGPGPGPDDPDLVRLFALLEQLGLQVRKVNAPQDIPGRLPRIQDYLQVEGRECLDRLAEIDREIDLLQKEEPPGTRVEPLGTYALTPAGVAALPEAAVLEALEATLQTACGPLTPRSASHAHVREDPASLLSLLVEGTVRGERPSALLGEYDALLEAYERVAPFAELPGSRPKLSLLLRLLRAARDEPKLAYLWANRDRLRNLSHRLRPLVPLSLGTSGWHLVYAADLFLVDGGLGADEAVAEQRAELFQAVHRIQAELLEDIRIGDGQFVRLALALTHAARVRRFAPGVLLDRFVRQALDTVMAAAQGAPYDLGDRGTKLMFGAHLAHAAGYAKARLPEPVAAFASLQAQFQAGGGASLPLQVQLHAFATLDRLQRLEAPLPPEAYAGLLARLRKHLRHHKAATRAFRAGQAQAGDEDVLAVNLCACVCFQGLTPPAGAPHHPDVGLAGLYEDRRPGLAPLLGSPFGTLMLN